MNFTASSHSRVLSAIERWWLLRSWRTLVGFTLVLGVAGTLIGAAPLEPSSLTPTVAQVGQRYAVDVAALGAPQTVGSYRISGLPAGVVVVGATYDGGVDSYAINAPYLQFQGIPQTAGSYTVRITAWSSLNQSGTSQAYDYPLTVAPAPATAPAITMQPASMMVISGAAITFMVSASGSPAPTFQWQKNGVAIGGATGSSYSLPSVTADDAGSYTVVAGNTAGSVTSNAAVLTVIIPPSNAVISFTVE